ncbi:ABC transporter permease [Burkholderia sp. Ax-1719]|uniref:ABC transporter permease n=1 Tax=Burkholderia sp. Ax-1719 TaxID=2608334 RepID=UPI00141F845E|nr:ABC transporter permease [Burkholderia sp. Ax-1719]NIE62540.1 ABC transporter permease [Burkholderia sp. Ax-1719]
MLNTANSTILDDTARAPLAKRAGGQAISWSALLPWVLPVFVYLLWWKAAHAGWMSAQILPAPELVWESARDLLRDGLVSNLLISLERLAIGFVLGTLGGALIGAFMGASVVAEEIISPLFYAVAQVPPLALLPLLMVLLGIGEALKLVLIFKAVAIPVAIHTQAGVRAMPWRLREVAGVLRLSAWQRVRLLVLPAALPAFLTGVRQALAQGWLTLIAVELLASSEGIGYLMVYGRQMFQLDVVFVCIVTIGLTGFAIDQGVQRIDRLLVRWPLEAPGARVVAAQRGWQRNVSRYTRGAVLPVLILAVWALVAHLRLVDANLLPAPGDVLNSALDDLRSGALPVPLAHTLARAGEGLAVGAATGLALGIALGAVAWVRRAFGPTLTALRQVAIFAWIPLLTAWAGLGDLSKVIFVALAAFFPVVLATSRAVEGLPPALVEVALTLRLNAWQRLRWLIVPAILPGVFAGLRLALVYAWLGAIGAEYLMPSGVGLGTYMIDAQQLFRTDRLLAAAVTIGALGALFGWLGSRLEASATRWRTRH